MSAAEEFEHPHLFLGAGHERNERRTWIVIGLCVAMMLLEIVGGLLFGSIALVADGLHMSTHAGALLLAALAYTFSRRYAHDPRFAFGTGKLGDLAGFTSAIVLAMIALLIGYEAVQRLLAPVPIHFGEAIPIATLGLVVNIASAWLLSGGHDHHHHHGHGHSEARGHDEPQTLTFAGGRAALSIFEDGVPPRFRLEPQEGFALDPDAVAIQTFRPDGSRQVFRLFERDGFLESREDVPEPHAFAACVQVGREERVVLFQEDEHGHHHHRDNNMRAAVVHVLADAAVSVLVIAGLLAARLFGWLWMDPLAGIVGALVIASWSYGLVRDTGAVLLDMHPDRGLTDLVRQAVEAEGDRVYDLHLWRLGPGHLGVILAVVAQGDRDAAFYRAKLAHLPAVSHLTVEVRGPGS
jgi:cation diffusion facilitator family transporter